MSAPSSDSRHGAAGAGFGAPGEQDPPAGQASWLPAGLAMHFSEVPADAPTGPPANVLAQTIAPMPQHVEDEVIPPFEPVLQDGRSDALLSQLRGTPGGNPVGFSRLAALTGAVVGIAAVLLGGKAAAALMLAATLVAAGVIIAKTGLSRLWVPVASGLALTGAAITIARLRSIGDPDGPVPLVAAVGIAAVLLLGVAISRIGTIADVDRRVSGRANAILAAAGLVLAVWGLSFLEVATDATGDQWWLLAWGIAASLCAAWVVRPVLGVQKLPASRAFLHLGAFSVCVAAVLAGPQLLGDVASGLQDVALTVGIVLLLCAAAGGSLLVDDEADEDETKRSILDRAWLIVLLVALLAAPLAAVVASEHSVSERGLQIFFLGWATANVAVVWAILRARQTRLEHEPVRDGELVARLVRAASAQDRGAVLLQAVDDAVGKRDGKVLLVTPVEGAYAVTAFLDRAAPQRVTPVRHGAVISDTRLASLAAHDVVRFDSGELPLDAHFAQASGVAVAEGERPAIVVVAQRRKLSRGDRARLATVGAAARETDSLLAVQASDARARGERRFRTLIEHAQDIVAVVDDASNWNFVSPAAERLLRRKDTMLLGTPWLGVVPGEDQQRAAEWLAAIRAGEAPLNLEVRLVDAAGVTRWFEISGLDLRNEPEIRGVVLNARETTQRRQAEAKRLAAEARFRALVQTSGDAIGVLDSEGRLQFASSAVSSVLGVEPSRLIGRHIREFSGTIVDVDRGLWAALAQIGRPDRPSGPIERSGELVIRAAGGEVRVLDVSVRDERDVEAIGGFVIAARDVTGQRAHERSTAVIAQLDPETGLATRVALGRRVLQVVQDLGSSSDVVAVIAVELAGISTLDERLHAGAANRTMIELTRRVRPMLTPRDLIARVGRDTIAVLLVDRHAPQVHDLAVSIRKVVSDPVVIRGAQIRLHTSVGMAIDHGRGQSDPLTSYQRAMQALEASKQRGGDIETAYANEPFDQTWGARLTEALDHNEFEVWYHPVIAVETGQVAAVEALARWRHPERGVLTPADFFEVVYRAGFIAQLGTWISTRALRDLASLIRRGANISLALNTSEKELRDVHYVERLADVLQEEQIAPSRLMIEVPERAFLAADRSIGPGVRRLRSLGVVTALDDFVGGPEALAYARQAGFDVVKVDRRAVSFPGGGGDSDALLTNLVRAAGQAGIEIMIEGVEDQRELDTLRQHGLRHAQGYLFAKPMPLSDLIKALGLR